MFPNVAALFDMDIEKEIKKAEKEEQKRLEEKLINEEPEDGD